MPLVCVWGGDWGNDVLFFFRLLFLYFSLCFLDFSLCARLSTLNASLCAFATLSSVSIVCDSGGGDTCGGLLGFWSLDGFPPPDLRCGLAMLSSVSIESVSGGGDSCG